LGYEVRVLDILSSGSLENFSQIMDGIEFIKGDCRNHRDVLDSMKDVEVVFHLAANLEVRLELCDPETCFREKPEQFIAYCRCLLSKTDNDIGAG